MTGNKSWDFDVAYVAMGSYTEDNRPKPEKPTKQRKRTKAFTGSYRPRRYFHQPRDLPLFTFDTIRNMLYDSTVRLALAMRAAPLQTVEFAYVDGIGMDGKPNWVPGVKAKNQAIAAWVLRQYQRIWNNYLPAILRNQVWGWCAGEITLKLSEFNVIEIDELHPRHSVDSRLMEIRSTGKPWGVEFRNVEGVGVVQLEFPYSYFINFRPEDGEKYSAPILLGAYCPWADKWFDGGALDTRRLFMHKDAYGGMKVGYPSEDIFIEGREEPISARDLAMQIVEQRAAGGVVTYPSEKDANGNAKWEIEEATITSNPQHILQFPKDLDMEIERGMEIPPGAISNDGSGAWEGKALPMAAFYNGLDTWVAQILKDLRNSIEPIAKMNFGDEGCDWEISHKPLALQAMEMQGEKHAGPDGMMGGMGGGMGADMGGQMQQPMMMSARRQIDPVEAVGEGIMSVSAIVKAARMALDTNEDIKKKAELIGSILTSIFGDDAEEVFDEVFGEAVQRMRAWNPIEHPRGPDGRFIEKNSPEAVSAAKQKITETLNAKRTPAGLRTVTEHLSILTTSQLRDVMREHGIKASGVKPSLVNKIASRLMGAITQTDEEADDNRPDGTPKDPVPQNVYTVPTDSLNVDPSRFQYKVKGIDAKSGVTEELKGSSKWNPELAGALLVWRDPENGKDYVVNGHHRHHLAKRLGAEELNVRYINADNARTARSKGALANIAEGRGSSVDAAKYLRDSGHDIEHLEKAGISLTGRIAAEASVLKDLADKPFQMVTEGRLDEQKAVAVAKHLKDHNLQNKLFRKMEKREDEGKEWSNREIETAAKKMANAGKVTQSGFDLFGSWEEEQDTFDQEVEIEAHVSRLLQQEANDFRAVANQRRADRVADAGNTLAVDENARRAQSATALFDDFEQQAKRRGPVADAIKYWAGELLGAKNRKQRDQIKTDALQSIRKVLSGAESPELNTVDDTVEQPGDSERVKELRRDYANALKNTPHNAGIAREMLYRKLASEAELRRVNEQLQSRGLVHSMSARRAPSGYSKDNPLVINGQEYFGGQFIPGDQLKHATAEQMKEIESGKRSESSQPSQPAGKKESKPTELEKGPSHDKHVEKLTQLRQLKLKNGHQIKIGYDSSRGSKGYYVRHYGPNRERSDIDARFESVAAAADYGAKVLHQKIRSPQPSAPKLTTERTEAKQPGVKRPKKNLGGERNWRYKTTDFYASGQKSKFNDNMEALRVLKTIELEDREPTKEEQETISKFVGWGQFPNFFDYNSSKYEERQEFNKWSKERAQLRSMLTDDEYKAARASTTNSHYTHPDIVKAHWQMARKLGFDGGRMLEPAVGSGYYLGFMPEDIAERTHVTAVEMDKSAAKIAKSLYPDADIKVSPFQDVKTPENFFDMTATNVPFDGNVKIYSKKYKIAATLHDYYFLRSLETTKPGGLIMQITSAGTMDKVDPKVRAIIEQEADLVSAIRFPGDSHKSNAGTEVVTDMLILRKKNPAIPAVTEDTPEEAEPKRPGFTGTTIDSMGRLYHWLDGKRIPGPKWDDVVEVPDPNGGEPIKVNKYFADRPANILGTLDRTGTMYTGGMKNVTRDEDYEAQLKQLIDDLPENAMNTARQVEQDAAPNEDNRILTSERLNQGQLVIRDGVVYQHDSGALTPLKIPEKQKAALMGMIEIRDAARDLIDKEKFRQDATEARAKLNQLYDKFVEEHGYLSEKDNRKIMDRDPDVSFLLALEKWNSTEKKATKADIFSKSTVRSFDRAKTAKDVADATAIVLRENGRVDIARMSSLLGKSREDVESELLEKGLAFPNLDGKWEHASLYLSGNVRQKLLDAREAAKTDPLFENHVRALEKVQPVDIDVDDIGLTMSSPWIPEDYLEQFAAEVLGVTKGDVSVVYSPSTQQYIVDYRNKYIENRESNRAEWGDFATIMEAALQNKPITVYKETATGRRIDQDATDQARDRMIALKEQFADWIWSDDARRDELHRIYNDSNNNIVPTNFDGSHLTFPGMKEGFEMRQLQKDFVWRVVTTGRGLAAHEVGTGKTASMVAAAMELRRMGLAKKPAIAVKKANIEQFAAEAQDLYPGARILSLGKNFTGEQREKTLQRIATGDYDMIILTHENLAAMQMKQETIKRFVSEELEQLEAALIAARKDEDEEAMRTGRKKRRGKSQVKLIESRKQSLENQLKKALDQDDKDAVFFEDTGIDQLFVDEAHKYKSLPIVTRHNRVKGIPNMDNVASRAMDMLTRCRYLQEQNNGRGVVFATGTPITNTMAELYSMQRYLQYDTLKERGLHHFDAWADTFGEMTHDLEIKLNGKADVTQRFARFINLPELRHLASEVMDIKLADDIVGLVRPKKHDKVTVAGDNPELQDFMADVAKRIDDIKGRRARKVRNAEGDIIDDTYLVINNDARAASIDMRLVDSSATDHPESKVNKMIENVMRIHNSDANVTQAIFSDIGIHDTNKAGFSLFKDIKRKLVARGIPESQIVDFSDPDMKDLKREEAQAAMRRGDVRIALGSTERLGTGTNIQTKLKALHHLDTPYVPAALEQRDGRAYRQKNQNKEIEVYKYIAENSADTTSWQILARKSGFISQFMKGDKSMRSMEDVATDSLSPEQMIAVAVGDTKQLKKLGVAEEIRRLERQQKRHTQQQAIIRSKIQEAPRRREELKNVIEQSRKDLEQYKQHEGFTFHAVETSYYGAKPNKSRIEDRAEADQHLKDRFQSITSDRYRVRDKQIAEYAGMPVYIDPQDRWYFETPSGQKVEFGGSIRSLEAIARRLETRHQQAKMNLELYENDLAQLSKASIGEWKNKAKLEEARRALQALEVEKMSLTPGQRQTVNGVEYVLNENHRWTRPDQNQQPATRQRQPDPKPAPQRQPAQPQPAQRPVPQPPAQMPQQNAQPAVRKQTPVKQNLPHLQDIDADLVNLAASEGNTPEHVRARKKVALHYLKKIAKSYDHKTNSMQPLDRGKVLGMLKGIDMSKPVLMGPPPQIPPPFQMVQWQAKGGYRGSYFSVPGTTPEQLGIYGKSKAWTAPGQPVLPREQTVFSTKNAKFDRVSFLYSTAAPTLDTWSDPGNTHVVAGGGPQWYIPVAAHPQIRVPKAKNE